MTSMWAEVNVTDLRANFAYLQRLVGDTVGILPVVKANAYGHGAREVAQILLDAGAVGVGVASVDEGVALRRWGIDGPIVLLEYMLAEQADDVAVHNLTPSVHSLGVLRALNEAAGRVGTHIAVHVRVDTLSGSMGVRVKDLRPLLTELARSPRLIAEGIFTHLTGAYSGDRRLVNEQVARFKQAIELGREVGMRFQKVHAASSPAILEFPDTYFDVVRPGTMLYGISSLCGQERGELRTVMQLKARVTHVEAHSEHYVVGYRDHIDAQCVERVATVAVGYSSGHFLLRSRGAEVLIRGRRAPLLGAARMAHLLVDVTEVPGVQVGDEVVLFGRQGDAEITVEEVAERAGISLVNCESVCLLHKDVPRVYLE